MKIRMNHKQALRLMAGMAELMSSDLSAIEYDDMVGKESKGNEPQSLRVRISTEKDIIVVEV